MTVGGADAGFVTVGGANVMLSRANCVVTVGGANVIAGRTDGKNVKVDYFYSL